MSILRTFSPLLFVTLGILITLMPISASAGCCGCCNCWMKYYTSPPCSCPGENGCSTCNYCKSNSPQFLALTSHSIAETTPLQVSTVANINLTQELTELFRIDTCLRAKVAFSLLRESFAPISFADSSLRAETSNLEETLR
jgi:hypothetical protein